VSGGEDPRHHAVHDVRDASIEASELHEESGRGLPMRDRVLVLLRVAGPAGLTDRELLRMVRRQPGQAKALKDSVSPARNALWHAFRVLPSGERSFLPDLETGRPTSSTGERWVAIEHASIGQVDAAKREWTRRFRFEPFEVERARRDIADLRLARDPNDRLVHDRLVLVDAGLLTRLLDYAEGSVRPVSYDLRALAVDGGRDP
jgi:hypothetical protein